jgi:hypothetical protein
MWRISHRSATEDTDDKTVWFGANRNIIYATIRKQS